ncbi:DNA-binding MarR family transcriptional regulator [Parabacteroides sp. PF5-5]|uniref:MarR family transcriptional regulator n=1 Tax=unclassified Parabacteroides TaxID=2649774 RepID=UPI00247596F5|nr:MULTISPECIES: MarR family transcriptional regulator [unclassified Parabacteroides]MDH6306277.1 DNA-binding MarR family transcriptional regulator [Parabacteroides sp. PH5-39]MDH6316932.1 DNA-binding MarR family transcriptional regulator [Parabacteroides sp. PF5-13]MDH6321001.1 DNA-binding MarR family transcriptional regulator [Parabacteroides sp. PH5-13]MDH6324733.1 DNA-binding MarR family transcriptional regulator [Parabacteroides sp. PH5-8]MDH6328117.1 DNA-binding MarR family transcription
MNYREITELIANLLSLTEAYTFLCLAIKSDRDTYESNIKQDNLAAYINDNAFSEKDAITQSTISKHISKFKAKGLLTINTRFVKGKNGKFARNKYFLNTEHYVLIDEALVKEPIPNELKGFLVLIKTLCLNSTNLCRYSIRELENIMVIKKSTIGKYLKMAIDMGYIKRTSKGIELINDKIFYKTRETPIAEMKRFCEGAITDEDYLAGKFLQ